MWADKTRALVNQLRCTCTRNQGSNEEWAGESLGSLHIHLAPPSLFIHNFYARINQNKKRILSGSGDTSPANNCNLILEQRVLNDSPNDFLCLIPSPLSNLIGKGILFQICFTPEVWTTCRPTPGELKPWESIWLPEKQTSRGGLQTRGEGIGRDIHLGICLQKRKLGKHQTRELMHKVSTVWRGNAPEPQQSLCCHGFNALSRPTHLGLNPSSLPY